MYVTVNEVTGVEWYGFFAIFRKTGSAILADLKIIDKNADMYMRKLNLRLSKKSYHCNMDQPFMSLKT